MFERMPPLEPKPERGWLGAEYEWLGGALGRLPPYEVRGWLCDGAEYEGRLAPYEAGGRLCVGGEYDCRLPPLPPKGAREPVDGGFAYPRLGAALA